MNRKSILNHLDQFMDDYVEAEYKDNTHTSMENEEIEWAINAILYLLKEIDEFVPAKDMDILEKLREENNQIEDAFHSKNCALSRIDNIIKSTNEPINQIKSVLKEEIPEYFH